MTCILISFLSSFMRYNMWARIPQMMTTVSSTHHDISRFFFLSPSWPVNYRSITWFRLSVFMIWLLIYVPHIGASAMIDHAQLNERAVGAACLQRGRHSAGEHGYPPWWASYMHNAGDALSRASQVDCCACTASGASWLIRRRPKTKTSQARLREKQSGLQ